MIPSTSTLEAAFGAVANQFCGLCAASASDPAALFSVVYGISDGNDYGRYFFGQNPLLTFADAAVSVSALIAQQVVQADAVTAETTAVIAAIGDAAAFLDAVPVLTETLRLACANPADAIRILSGLAQFSFWLPPFNTHDPIGVQLFILCCIATLRCRLAAAASLVRAVADYVPSSQQDAATLRDSVSDILDRLMLTCADLFYDETARALDAARVAVVMDLNARGGDLAQIVTRQFGASLPAPVMAYQLYGDATRADDLVARNNPAHPGFLPLNIEALAR